MLAQNLSGCYLNSRGRVSCTAQTKFASNCDGSCLLLQWAKQGVLLLNVCLTVRAHQANSHAKQGWEQFTDAAIGALNRKKRNVVFLLWGKSAELKAKGVDRVRHHVLTAAHPSGLSANRVCAVLTCCCLANQKPECLSNCLRPATLTSSLTIALTCRAFLDASIFQRRIPICKTMACRQLTGRL